MSNGLTLPFSGSVNSGEPAFAVLNDSGGGVQGLSFGGNGVTGLSGPLSGIPVGDGIFGQGKNGVHGKCLTKNDSGVLGENQVGGNGTGNGVTGLCNQSAGSGVWGNNTGGGYGVAGATSSAYQPGPNGTAGVYGNNAGSGIGVKGTSAGGDGVLGYSLANNHSGVSAVNDGGGYGLWAQGTPAAHFQGDVAVIGKITAEDVSGAHVTCLNGLSTTGPVSHVGDMQVTGSITAFNITANGDIFVPGADCAEHFDVAEAGAIEPGTVVVIDQEGALRRSWHAYDKKVAGVVSGAGGYRPGIVMDKQRRAENRLPVALVGKVYCKVDAGPSSIEVGDLLTTSPTPGHAMKASDPLRAFGAVIGKALRPWRSGCGMIPILVALQ